MQQDGTITSLSLLEAIQEGNVLGFFVQPDSQGIIHSLSVDNVSSPLHSSSSLDSSIYLSSSHSDDSVPYESSLCKLPGNALHVEREQILVSGRYLTWRSL